MSNNHQLRNQNLPPVSDQPQTTQIHEELSETELESIAGGLKKGIRMLRRVVIGVVAAGLALSTIEVQPAQSRNSCQVALAEAKNQLKSKNVRVVRLNTFDMNEDSEFSGNPDEHPEKYPIGVSIAIEGSGAESVMNSTNFLKALSSNIIFGCESVSLVKIGVNSTDYINTFGLLGRNVEEFKCLPAGETIRHVPWGHVVCVD